MGHIRKWDTPKGYPLVVDQLILNKSKKYLLCITERNNHDNYSFS